VTDSEREALVFEFCRAYHPADPRANWDTAYALLKWLEGDGGYKVVKSAPRPTEWRGPVELLRRGGK